MLHRLLNLPAVQPIFIKSSDDIGQCKVDLVLPDDSETVLAVQTMKCLKSTGEVGISLEIFNCIALTGHPISSRIPTFLLKTG